MQNHSPLHGAEYQQSLQGADDSNVPCAVCLVATRLTAVMIPAKASCPPNWTREYYGYVMSGGGNQRSTFECIDEAMDAAAGGDDDTNGALFYHAEASCSTGLPCPPYNDHQELNCVLCTK